MELKDMDKSEQTQLLRETEPLTSYEQEDDDK